MAQWLSWLERRPVTAKVEGSSPFWVAIIMEFEDEIVRLSLFLYVRAIWMYSNKG